MRVYLDTCCLNRPFDDQTQPRVRRETGAVLSILGGVLLGDIQWIASTVLLSEIRASSDPERRTRLDALTEWANETVTVTEQIEHRGKEVMGLGLAALDALHLACAEAAGVDVFLTTDDRLLRRARRLRSALKVGVDNPVTWLRGQNG